MLPGLFVMLAAVFWYGTCESPSMHSAVRLVPSEHGPANEIGCAAPHDP